MRRDLALQDGGEDFIVSAGECEAHLLLSHRKVSRDKRNMCELTAILASN